MLYSRNSEAAPAGTRDGLTPQPDETRKGVAPMIEHLDPFTDSDRIRVIQTTTAGPHGNSYKLRMIRAALDAPDWEYLFRAQSNAYHAEGVALGSDA